MDVAAKGYTSWANMWLARGGDLQAKDILSDIMEGNRMKVLLEGRYSHTLPTRLATVLFTSF